MDRAFRRVTTVYVENEDRVRLTGASDDEAVVVVWLTQRIVRRLVPALLRWLERTAPGGAGEAPADRRRAELVQGFAQRAARSAMTGAEPVRPEAAGEAWLALSVDLGFGDRRVQLAFVSEGGQRAAWGLGPRALRQWLGVLYVTCGRAGWPVDIWPDWLREAFDRKDAPPPVVH